MQKSNYQKLGQSFAAWLRDQREQKGLSLRDVERLTGIDHSVIGKIEKSKRRMDMAEFILYCDALGLDPAECVEYLLEQ